MFRPRLRRTHTITAKLQIATASDTWLSCNNLPELSFFGVSENVP